VIDQYSADNDDDASLPSSSSNKENKLIITPVGRTTQLAVGNQSVNVIDPRLVDQLQQQVIQLSHKLTHMENKCQKLQQQHQNLARLVVDLQSQIKDFS
jgi:TolA-binding protein